MTARYITLTCLYLLIGAAGLSACGNNRGAGTAFTKSLGTGGNRLQDHQSTGACLNLSDLAKTLSADDGGVALHSRDYDLGQVLSRRGERGILFTPAKDEATTRLIARRATTGANAPTYLTANTGAELLKNKAAADLIDVAEQTGCSSVKFKSGASFKVLPSDANHLRLVNEEAHQTREYAADREALIVTIYAPVDLKDCEGRPSLAKVERISSRFTWGASLGSVKLSPSYAGRLGTDASTSFIKFQGKLKNLSAQDTAATCGAN